MTSAKVNGKALVILAFLCGVCSTWLLFRFGIMGCTECATDIDSVYLTRHVQCKSSSSIEGEEKLGGLMSPLLGSQTKATDARLVTAIREHFVEYPRPFLTKFSLPITQTPQAKEVDAILHEKTGGFFIECGALDGERASNTNWLEQKRGWHGLLIEMDPSYYMQIRGKNRKSLSMNACLSPYEYPVKMDYKEHHMGEGRLVTSNKTRTVENQPIIHTTYCFPFYSVMLALNRTKIDYFSLDVEGMELQILRTIPFDKIDISVLTVEYNHGAEGAASYLKFMESKGYNMHKRLNFFKKELYLGGNDYVFVKKSL